MATVMRWIGLCLLLAVIVLGTIFSVRSRVPASIKANAAAAEKQLEIQRAFEASPEGKRVAAQHEKALRDTEAAKLGRDMLARDMEKFLLDQGVNAQCFTDESKRALIITGPSVNRVFAHQFVTSEVAAKLRKFGFTTVSFSNSKSGFSDEYFSQDFDITSPGASQ